jgi:hypothetical protein
MPSWSDLVKQKPIAKATTKVAKVTEVRDDLSVKSVTTVKSYKHVKSEPITFECDYGLKNEDEEFDFKYGDTLLDIAIEFRDFLEQSSYPIFPNNKLTLKLQDYMKYYCHNYEKVIQEVDNYNDELEKEMDELENEEK